MTPNRQIRLVAAMIVRNELERYLPLSIASLLSFCDEVRVIDDYSSDGSYEWLRSVPNVHVLTNPAITFDEHEGKARQALLDWVRDARPTHVIAIDGDEFVTNGDELRKDLAFHADTHVWGLEMQEVWEADESGLMVRQDGGWKSHPVPVVWRIPPRPNDEYWKIREKALACGREPEIVSQQRHSARFAGIGILHFGWTNKTERKRRYDRYMALDGGRFHASRHLQSIMWEGRRVRLEKRAWPPSLDRDAILHRVRQERG
jgi:glycosyltransferase involved in cell wall biosynthesis